MSAKWPMIRVTEVDDPRRCQAPGDKGQCMFRAVEVDGEVISEYCAMHGGHKAASRKQRTDLANYRLTQSFFRDQLEQQPGDSEIKTLRDEIRIARVLLQTFLNKCQSDNDVLQYSHTISDLTLKIEKLVKSCHTIESSMGQLLDKTALMTFATQVVGIIGNYVDADSLNLVADEILRLLTGDHDDSSTVSDTSTP